MCTAATYRTKDFYMGRTLDYEFSYGEEVTVMPRRYPLAFRYEGTLAEHYAIIGMAHVAQDYPLYYDAVNEKGLGMAGLNFVGNACYAPEAAAGRRNAAQFEFIPWVLSQCATLAEARALLAQLNLTGQPFSSRFPAAQLHWLIADETGAIVVESVAGGVKVYDDPAGVLTNNPPFPQQMFSLNNYMHLSPRQPENMFSAALPLSTYSRGMGALGCPATCPPPPGLPGWPLPGSIPAPVRARRTAWASFSTSSARWSSSGAAARWARTVMRSPSIPPAGTPTGASITTPPIPTGRSPRWTCTAWRWMARHWPAIP